MFSRLDPQLIRGELKRVGSSDPDVLYSTKMMLLALPKAATKLGWMLVALSVIAVVTIIGIPIAIGLLPVAIFLLMRGSANKKTIETVFAEFTRTIE